jgi:hypothetical protein
MNISQVSRNSVLVILLFFYCGVSSAQTEYGQYPAGAFGQMKAAVVPGDGSTVIENGTLIYSARDFIDGNEIKQNFETTVVANRTLIMRTTSLDILGADYAIAGAIPFGNFAAPRPLPGDEKALGLGDVYLQPLTLGWHGEGWHTVAAYGLFAPTGRFTYGASDNTGRGFWSHLLTVGGTYIEQKENPWNMTIQGRYEIPMEIDGSDISPGQAFIAEYSLGKTVGKNLDLGLVGYAAMQTTDISGSDFNGDPTKYRYFGTGLELQYLAIKASSWSMTLSLRSYLEYKARNAPQGNFSLASFAFLF